MHRALFSLFGQAHEGVWSDKGSAQTWFDPLAPDFAAFPRARGATPYVAVCGPGDTILVPSDWFHYAVALTPSITLMRNFMNDHNVRAAPMAPLPPSCRLVR